MTMQQPYNYIIRNNEYIFVTDYGIQYSIEIEDGSSYFFSFKPYLSVYELSIDIANVEQVIFAPYDRRVELTILAILKTFFQDHSNSIIYVCDSIDRRHHARNRKFDSWFQRNNDGTLEKYDVEFSTENMEILASLIVHVNNPFKDELVQLFLAQPDEYDKDRN
jgi:Family of unknown function (DUF6169)